MNRASLVKAIKEKKSVLCVGLDTDLNKIPKHLLARDPHQTERKLFIGEIDKSISS